MSNRIDGFAMRHALPLDGSQDTGVDPSALDAIDEAALVISLQFQEPTIVTVFASPALRAVQTAEALLRNSALETTQSEPEVWSELAEGALDSYGDYDRSLKWMSTIFNMAKVAILNAGDRRPVMVLVTHDPVLRQMPHLKGRDIKTDHAQPNHFLT